MTLPRRPLAKLPKKLAPLKRVQTDQDLAQLPANAAPPTLLPFDGVLLCKRCNKPLPLNGPYFMPCLCGTPESK